MILCADDYGLGEDIDRAILQLCGLGRLSAVSCMAALEKCGPDSLARLLAHQAKIDIGLHLCLADETIPVSAYASSARPEPHLPSYGTLLRRALSGRISTRDARSTVARQYELFVRNCGRRPDYIDGHLHAHQLPGVREGLIEFVTSLPADQRPYIRNTRMSPRTLRQQRLPWVKSALIGHFGKGMERRLRAAGLRTNDGFAGVYDFRAWRRYPDYFPCFAACLPDRTGILVVHPGENEEWRRQEFETLGKFPFLPSTPNRFGQDSPN